MKFLLGRPKWNHPDPKVRGEAVALLDDDEILGVIARNDAEPEIRRIAVERISDPELLAEIACEKGATNLVALERLQDQRLIARVARRAESAEVRCRAVTRVQDELVVQRISAEDTNPMVRRQAKARLAGPNNTWLFLKAVLSKLEVAELKARNAAEVCADLDGICDRLASDARFQVHGFVAEPEQRPTVVELLANNAQDPAVKETLKLSSYYHIEIRRTGENAFDLKVNERESRSPFAVATTGSTPPV